MPELLCNNTLSFSSSSLDAVSFNAFSSSWSLALTPEQSFSAAFSRSVSVFFSVSLLRNCWLTSSSRLDQTPSVSLYKKENGEDLSFPTKECSLLLTWINHYQSTMTFTSVPFSFFISSSSLLHFATAAVLAFSAAFSLTTLFDNSFSMMETFWRRLLNSAGGIASAL